MKTKVSIILNRATQERVKFLIETMHANGYHIEGATGDWNIVKWFDAIGGMGKMVSSDSEKIIYIGKGSLGWDYKTDNIIRREIQDEEVEYYMDLQYIDIPDIINLVVKDELSYHISLIRKEINDSNNS